uniref:Beta-Casp domain-containing protein n=1 Tax=Dunaliella tertiolecta TaxID=3047 RepID=A0A7S3VGZ5_DUNTE|mmetsp:Transcript_5328/g.14308  ORF Transcript_5328/g.14308 Transcript_5328/m.14308 type:complete len:690 (+) Transcript_5328:107-2176(+)|eukprot:CAMPEP_0202387518 /NCGR_PEP_ID=MMETSP1127-20130417/72534_1 /ASSEMBLY_ACC=CAM_ASM_000462 /TAXON_ID=3047 /ORGANISM="Dunaliella tertiolecta, Strain CCMP1320" /LENGTH=689 /DNA_ID=CAMNT_0048988561 /DNA_START=18 /DNA_END=2087 /DNA_ORIENTATION=-
MKVTCIGTSAARCLILTLRKTNILLDCGLWGCSGVLHKLLDPHDLGPPRYLTPLLQLLECYEIEAALISTPEGMLALPLLLMSSPGLIKGPIYATTAAMDVAKHLFAELLAVSCFASSGMASAGSLQQETAVAGMQPTTCPWLPKLMEAVQAKCLDPAVFESCWLDMYDARAAEDCFERIKPVRYGQQVPLDGYELFATPYPAGSGFGHAVWTVTDGCRRIGYLSSFRAGAAGHALELEAQTLSALDALIAAPGCIGASAISGNIPGAQDVPVQAPCATPSAGAALQLPALTEQQQQLLVQQAMQCQQRLLQQLKQSVLTAVSEGGSALIPLPASGVAWDVLEAVARTLELADLGNVPILYVSPCAQDSLALANTSMEFLNLQRQARAYVPEPAFPFPACQKSGRLVLAHSLEEAVAKKPGCLDGPCVVVASLASLSAGPALQLLHMWGQRSQCMLVLTTGATDCAPALVADLVRSAHPTLRMRVALCNFGATGDACQLALLLSQLRVPPAQLLMTCTDVQQLSRFLHGLGRLPGTLSTQTHAYSWMDVLSVRLPKHMSRLSVPSSLLQNAQWQPMAYEADSIAAQLSGTMLYEQGRGWQLKPGPGQGRQCKPQALQAPMQGTLPAHMQGFFQAPMRGNLQAPKQGSLRAPVQRTQEPPRLGATNPLPLAEGIPQSLQDPSAWGKDSAG